LAALIATLSLQRAVSCDEASPRTVAVVAEEGACPARSSIEAALARGLPKGFVLAGPPSPAELEVVVTDAGPRYQVRIGEVEQEYDDPGRVCEERARTAAVLAAVTLGLLSSKESAAVPPSLPASPPTVAPPPPTAPAPPPRRARVDGLVIVSGEAVLALPSGATGGGGSVRAALFLGRFGVAVGAAGLAPIEVDLPAARITLVRIPLDVDAVVRLGRGRLHLAVSLGLALDVVSATAAVDLPRRSTGVEPGVRVAAEIGVKLGPIVPVLSVGAEWFAAPASVVVDNQTVGTLPAFWLGASIGIAFPILGKKAAP
jgi:hypothetical protein